MPEWSIGTVSKTVTPKGSRGFESHLLRCACINGLIGAGLRNRDLAIGLVRSPARRSLNEGGNPTSSIVDGFTKNKKLIHN